MTPRTKRLFTFLLIVVIIAVIGIGTYLLFFNNKDNALHVQRISAQEVVDHKTAYFSESRLWIYPYGAFEIQLIRTIGDDETEIFFVGNGTYTKTKKAYTFTYADSYSRGVQRKDYSQNCPIGKDGRVRFDASWGISYYFGR